jgi:predicted nucleotidyltransferase
MEDIKDRLGEYKYNFLKKLENYIGTELIFYGSIKRCDYFEENSDIDIAIITDNMNSTLEKLQVFLNIKKSNIKKILQKFSDDTINVVYGYKIKYADLTNNLTFDILVYDEKYKKYVLENINDINNLPFYMVIILTIVKIFFYNLRLMSKSCYLYLKNFIFYTYFNKKFTLYNKNLMTTIIIDN